MHSLLHFLALASLVVALSLGSAAAADKAPAGDRIPTSQGDLVIVPVQHASLALQWGGKTIYVDPAGGAARFAGLPRPDAVLITDIHFDHLDPDTLKAVLPAGRPTPIVAPKAVVEKLPAPLAQAAVAIAPGEKKMAAGIPLEAVAAYNITPSRQKFHPKGRGVGFLLELGGKRVYLAGDTEETPEMRALKGIDVAFLPMNLPYTMSVEQAAEAAKTFRPKIVYPYHFRNGDGTKADLAQFKKLLGPDSGIEVRVGNWYEK